MCTPEVRPKNLTSGVFFMVKYDEGFKRRVVDAYLAAEGVGIFGIAMAFGLSIVAMAYTIGTVSGAHVNPAVSIAMYVNKRITVTELAYYIGGQLIGAVMGSLVLYYFLASSNLPTTNLGQNSFGELTTGGAFIVEFILTFVFVLAIIIVTGKKGNAQFAGLVIGLTLVLIHLLGIPLTGTSVNPARSFEPALFAGGEAISQLWLFFLSPILGAIIAAIVGKFVFETEEE